MAEGDQNYLKLVILSSDVHAMCIQHALTNEKEENMGLLIGEVDEDERTSNICAAVILHRSVKQPDRVEISPEHTFQAAMYAENIAKKINKPIRVLGWYHSHPHVTVWPSHVDVRTQAAYQGMDPFFVGLIFSVYHNDAGSSANHVQVTCFQSIRSDSDYSRREIELLIKPAPFLLYNLERLLTLPKILFEEEVNGHAQETHDVTDDLAILHNNAIKTVKLVNIVSKIAKPLCTELEGRLNSTMNRIKELEKLKKYLQDKNKKVG